MAKNLKKTASLFLPILASVLFSKSIYAAKIVAPNKALCPGVYNTYQKNKGQALSCTRSSTYQLAMVTKLNHLGRRGQAAKKSDHALGCACDFSSRKLEKANCTWSDKNGQKQNHCSNSSK